MNIAGLDKAKVLITLYNRAKPQGLGYLQHEPVDMDIEEAKALIEERPYCYWDYLKGRVMKIDLSKDEVETRLYNRDNGPGAAEMAVEMIR